MVQRKLRSNRLEQLNDNLEKQDAHNGWILVDKPYYCESIRRKIDTSLAHYNTD
jgi:hypothetical protein